MSLRDKIVNAVDYNSEIHEVKEWGVSVLLRSMTAGTRNKISLKYANEKGEIVDMAAMSMDVLAASLFDPETNEQVFSLDDVDELNKKAGNVIEPLLVAAMKLNGFGKDAVKDEEKNS